LVIPEQAVLKSKKRLAENMAAEGTNKALLAEYAQLMKKMKATITNVAKQMEEDRAIIKAAEQQQHE
jgi:hypothetical protein